ncbi:hypothetical protein J3R82DRAFT_11681 [Butyriboletus roseoflavus]|nr:hypothetical protein J3R82DRAFT_11681 [Butyriboletus roseoflavus]
MFHSRMYSSALTSLLRDVRARLLIVHGDRDDFTSHSQYDTWTKSLKMTEGVSAQVEDSGPWRVQVIFGTLRHRELRWRKR